MGKKTTQLNISVKKTENFGQWYSEVIVKSELIGYYEDVSGCYILRPWSYRIWEQIQSFFDTEIKLLGVEPCYFPMFVSKRALETEEEHLEGFAPEVAWVTRSGSTELDNPIAIRPTSETIMYPAYSKWIRSHRDLPLRLNQWTNIVRWEFKNPTPFLRTREFLWQEGHTAFETKEEADQEVLQILDLYARVYEELLAVPVLKGRKSEKEKFAGADYTTTVEAYVPAAGRAVQGGTSHSLGQNFSKMFNISYTKDEEGQGDKQKHFVWQNSWGLTTRTIGVCVMVHGDDKGLVLPPRIAPVQVIVIPILKAKTSDEIVAQVQQSVTVLTDLLVRSGLRAKSDLRSDKNPGWKYNFWEQKGVPLRIEIGEQEIADRKVCFVRRDNGDKSTLDFHTMCSVDVQQRLVELINKELASIQKAMLHKARKQRDERVSIAWDFKEFIEALGKGNLVLAPWSLTTESEEWVKAETQRIFSEPKADATPTAENEVNESGESKQLTGAAKTLCIPFNQPDLPPGTKCFTGCGKDAREWCLWGRSY